MSNINSVINYEELEIHYYFNDSTHSMDAFVQNNCESEVLKIIREVAEFLKIEIDVFTEPLEDGGLKRLLKVIEKSAKDYPLLTLLTVGLLGSPAKDVSTNLINKIFEDKELVELQKENFRKQNRNLDAEYDEKLQHLSKRNTIIKKVSNFYENLKKEPKVEKVSYQTYDEKKRKSGEVFIYRKDFEQFILPSNELEPLELENQSIEIISPDLKGGKYKWKGIYKGSVVSFTMNSKTFKNLVKAGRIEFKNGSSIICDMEINRSLNSEGNELIKSISVTSVTQFFEADKPIETPDGKTKRRQAEAEKQMLKFDFENGFD